MTTKCTWCGNPLRGRHGLPPAGDRHKRCEMESAKAEKYKPVESVMDGDFSNDPRARFVILPTDDAPYEAIGYDRARVSAEQEALAESGKPFRKVPSTGPCPQADAIAYAKEEWPTEESRKHYQGIEYRTDTGWASLRWSEL